MPTFSLVPEGPFALSAALRFLADFTPAAYAPDDDGVLRLAFPADDGLHVVGCAVRQPGDTGAVRVTWTSDGAAPAAVRAQVARVLSLDVDGSGFPAVGRADPVVGRLQARFPGLRPVCFFSPYEAAAWTVIGNRLRMTRAAAVKDGLARAYGETLTVAGRAAHAFPLPAVLRGLDPVPGVSAVKTRRLHALAEAALDGRLDAAALRALPPGEALARLRELPGIGPFSAELVLVRGAGHPDLFPRAEPRLHEAMAEAYGLPRTPEALAPVAALVNSAGVSSPVPFLEADLATWERVMRINATGTFVVSRRLVPGMVERGHGRVVSLGSTAMQNGGGTYSKSTYAASKGAIEAFSRALALEVAPHGVTVNVVAPATIDTDIMGGRITDDRKPDFLAQLPVGRLGTTRDVAALVEFLLGADAGYITGATYNINGGLRIG